jgi:hypothetical protein
MKIPSIEDCQAFLDGQGPTNSLDRALLAKMNAAQLRQKIKEEKESMDRYVAELERVRPKNQPQPPARRPAPAPTSKAPAAPAARPLKAESTATLARALKLKSISENDRQAIRAELEQRNVTILKTGYSEPAR